LSRQELDCYHATLEQALRVLSELSDGAYRSVSRAAGGTIGAHLRHIADHIDALRYGCNSGVVDYDRRTRGGPIEHSCEAGKAYLRQAQQWLKSLPEQQLQTPLRVRSDMGLGEPRLVEHSSHLGRELMFVFSHAVHHYALIDIIARDLGHRLPAEFGVAPATLNQAQPGQSQETRKPCAP